MFFNSARHAPCTYQFQIFVFVFFRDLYVISASFEFAFFRFTKQFKSGVEIKLEFVFFNVLITNPNLSN